MHYMKIRSKVFCFVFTRIYTNPYHIFIACILLMQAIMRLIIIAISDPGYIIEEDNEDIESEIVCSISF